MPDNDSLTIEAANHPEHRLARRVVQRQNDPLLDTIEAANHLRVDPRTLAAWRRRRRGPVYHRYSHRCIRYKLSDLDRWLAARCVEDPAASGAGR